MRPANGVSYHDQRQHLSLANTAGFAEIAALAGDPARASVLHALMDGRALTDALVNGGYVELACDAGWVTNAGRAFFARIGNDVAAPASTRSTRPRVLCRPCLDWSERRPHLAGALGAALCEHSLRQGWIRRLNVTRAVAVTKKGKWCFARRWACSYALIKAPLHPQNFCQARTQR